MPSSTPERRARWGIDPSYAETFLRFRGYCQTRDWRWFRPGPARPTLEDEEEAIIYLIEEWDYGGLLIIRRPETWVGGGLSPLDEGVSYGEVTDFDDPGDLT